MFVKTVVVPLLKASTDRLHEQGFQVRCTQCTMLLAPISESLALEHVLCLAGISFVCASVGVCMVRLTARIYCSAART
jgi:hypothetical protein